VPTAFVLVNTDMKSENRVLRALKKIDSVKEAYNLYGTYDILAKIETKTMSELTQIVTRRIRKIDGVRSTLTMVVSDETTKAVHAPTG
jgi:DNA-binding Lrp family transcriptional regulator